MCDNLAIVPSPSRLCNEIIWSAWGRIMIFLFNGSHNFIRCDLVDFADLFQDLCSLCKLFFTCMESTHPIRKKKMVDIYVGLSSRARNVRFVNTAGAAMQTRKRILQDSNTIAKNTMMAFNIAVPSSRITIAFFPNLSSTMLGRSYQTSYLRPQRYK